MGLEGTLDTFSLSDILGLLERSQKTGALDVEGPDGHGTLYLAAGRFCAGEAADYAGPVDDGDALDVRLVDVCFHLFRFPSGTFSFVPDRSPSWPAGQATDIAPIVERVERVVREWPIVESAVPSLDAPVTIADDLDDGQVTVSRSAFRLLTVVDGHRSARQLARATGRSVVEIGYLLKGLVEQGAVRIGGRAARREPETEPAVAGLVLPPGALHAVRERAEDGAGALVTSVPDPTVTFDPDALERERAALAARAGLGGTPAVPDDEPDLPPEDVDEEEEEEHAEPAARRKAAVTADRGALLRLFSGLRDQG